MTVRMEPSTGPAQGVQTRPSVVPSTKPPSTLGSVAALPPLNPPKRPASFSNGAGQSISRPKPASRIAAALRSTLGSKSNTRVIALSASATSENDTTKPSAIITGRALLVWPTDAPRRIGSIGNVQGAAMVMTPASSARTRLSIRNGPPRSSCDPLRGRRGGRYSGTTSRVRDASKDGERVREALKPQAPGGGHRGRVVSGNLGGIDGRQ